MTISKAEIPTENCIACVYEEIEDKNGEHCSICLNGDSQFKLDKEFVDKCNAEDCTSRK